MSLYPVKVPVTKYDGKEMVYSLEINTASCDFRNRLISKIDLSPLAALLDLREINLTGNRLGTVDLSPVAAFSHLQRLSICDNELESIDLTPLSKCTMLEKLSLDNNHLLGLDLSPLSTCRNLREMSARNNFLKELNLLPLESCTRLEKIELHMNDLTYLDFSPIIRSPRLKRLSCDSHLEIRVNPVYWKTRVTSDKLDPKTEARVVDFGVLFKSVPPAPDVVPDRRTVADLLKEGEGQTTEFKSTFRLDRTTKSISDTIEHAAVSTVCGFMNSKGGVLLLGVQDDTEVVGIQEELVRVKGKNHDGYELVVRQAVERALGRSHESLVQIQFEPWGDKETCRVSVTRSFAGPVFLKPKKGDEEFWVRFGNSTKKLTGQQMVDYVGENWPEQYIRVADSGTK